MRDDRFLITGLPRSRTAWMAALCNTIPDVRCVHEPCARAPTWRKALDAWDRPQAPCVGIADPTLSLHLEAIIAEYEPRVLWIDRLPLDVEASLRRLGYERTNIIDLIIWKMEKCWGSSSLKIVTFDALRYNMVVQECLDFLVPGRKTDFGVIEQFQRLNIQVIPEVTKHEIGVGATLPEVFGEDVYRRLRRFA